ncbi:Uncharacterised protein [Mycobacteroides abscessus subsp. abscessus]|nr:Uncharacterised protein [Mycobacteroides abscessus subsp. abscessus]
MGSAISGFSGLASSPKEMDSSVISTNPRTAVVPYE